MFLLMFFGKEPNLTEPWALLGYIKLRESPLDPIWTSAQGRRGGGDNFPATVPSCLLMALSPCLFHVILALCYSANGFSQGCTQLELRDKEGCQGSLWVSWFQEQHLKLSSSFSPLNKAPCILPCAEGTSKLVPSPWAAPRERWRKNLDFSQALSINLSPFLLYRKLWERKDAKNLACREEQDSCGQRLEEEKEQRECSPVGLKQGNRAAGGQGKEAETRQEGKNH